MHRVLVIDADGALPPYEQVRNQLAERIDTGELAPGERLPTVRGLATELGLAANTVARAYRELEQAGIVATRGRKGTFVVDAADQPWRRDAEAAARGSGLPPALAGRATPAAKKDAVAGDEDKVGVDGDDDGKN